MGDEEIIFIIVLWKTCQTTLAIYETKVHSIAPIDIWHSGQIFVGRDLSYPFKMLSNSSIWPCVVSSQLKHSAYARVAVRSGYRANRACTPAATPFAVRSDISTPAAGAATTSGVPQTFDATTGVPQAIASNSTFGQPSRLEASTSASAAL